jgi:ABC-type glucose/galactose transport system permease subunit
LRDGAWSPRRSALSVKATLIAVGLLAAACTSGPDTSAAGRTKPTAEVVSVTSLQQVSQLRDRFNDDVGKVRLVLLLSPT